MKSTEELIKEVAREVVQLLLEKNESYGDTANNPPQIFSKLSAKEGILARLDDKLSRIKHKGLNDLVEDTVSDIIGYLILYKVQVKKDEQVIKDKLIKWKNESEKMGIIVHLVVVKNGQSSLNSINSNYWLSIHILKLIFLIDGAVKDSFHMFISTFTCSNF